MASRNKLRRQELAKQSKKNEKKTISSVEQHIEGNKELAQNGEERGTTTINKVIGTVKKVFGKDDNKSGTKEK